MPIAKTLENAGKDVLHAVESPFTFLDRASAVLETAIKDQPVLKTDLTLLVQKASLIGASVAVDAGQRGLNLAADAATLAQVEAFFQWFNATIIPVVETVYKEIHTDVEITATPAPAAAVEEPAAK